MNRLRELRRALGVRELTEQEQAEFKVLKLEASPMTRNITRTTIRNKKGDVLRVEQSFVIVPINEQRETQEKEVFI